MNSFIMNKQINQYTIILIFFLNIQEKIKVLHHCQKLPKYTKSPMPDEIVPNVFKCMFLSRYGTPLLCTVHT